MSTIGSRRKNRGQSRACRSRSSRYTPQWEDVGRQREGLAMEGQRRSGRSDSRDASGGKTNRPDCTGDWAFTANDLSGVAGSAASRLIVRVGIWQLIRLRKSFWQTTLIEKVGRKGPGICRTTTTPPPSFIAIEELPILLRHAETLTQFKVAKNRHR